MLYYNAYVNAMVEHVKEHPSIKEVVATTDKLFNDKPATVKPKVPAKQLDLRDIVADIVIEDKVELTTTGKFFRWLWSGEYASGHASVGQMVAPKRIKPLLLPPTEVITTDYNGQVNMFFKPNLFSFGQFNPTNRTSDEFLHSVTSFYVDLDLDKAGVSRAVGLREALEAVKELGLPAPQAIWFTGHGTDLLWKINAKVINSPKFIDYYKAVLTALQKAVPYADGQVTSPSNFLRLPATTNDKSYEDPAVEPVTGRWIKFEPAEPNADFDKFAKILLKDSKKPATVKPKVTTKKTAEPATSDKHSTRNYGLWFKVNDNADDTSNQKAWRRYLLGDVATYIKLRNRNGLNIHRYELLLLVRQMAGDQAVVALNQTLNTPLDGSRLDYLVGDKANTHKGRYTLPAIKEWLEVMELTPSEEAKMKRIKTPETVELNKQARALKPKVNSLLKQLTTVYVNRSTAKSSTLAKKFGVSARTITNYKTKGATKVDNDAILDAMQSLANLLIANVKAGGTFTPAKLDELIVTLQEVQSISRFNQNKLSSTILQLSALKADLA